MCITIAPIGRWGVSCRADLWAPLRILSAYRDTAQRQTHPTGTMTIQTAYGSSVCPQLIHVIQQHASKYVELWLPVFYWSLLPAALQPFEHRCTKSGPQIDNRLVISQIDHPSVIKIKLMTRRLSRCQNMHSVARTLWTAVLDTAEVVR